MDRYEFTITLGGYGTTPEQAWEDACDGVMGDKRFSIYDPDTIETVLTEKDVE